MSLRVWLPLTKDLRQQGLSDCTVEEITSPVFDNNGKLGKTLSEGKIRIPASKVGDIFNNNTMTVAFWYNNNTSNTSGNHAICGFSGNGEGDTDAVRIWDFFNYSVPTQFHWSMGTLGGGGLANAFPANTWVHVCVTWSAPTLKIYLDGVLKYTGSGSSNYTFDKSYYISFGHTPQKLNDFRIYDHALSQMEVKELAKGLVLHYPLNRQGWGQENLLPGSYKADGNTTNKIYGWQANGFGAPEIIKVDNVDCIHLQASCTGKYIPSIVSASKVFLEYGIEYTISCDLKFDKDITVTNSTPIHYHSGSSSSTDEFNTANINNGHGFNFKSISPAVGTTIPANTWQHYEQHIIAKTAPTDSFLPYLTYRAFIYGAVRTTSETATVNMWLKNWKIEKGSIPTPWCPNSADALATTMGLNSTTEYDCSGFCNNGEKIGTLTYTSDTPKYAVSTHIGSTSSKIHISNFPTSGFGNSYSFAWWGKNTTFSNKMFWGFSDGIRLNGMYGGVLWNTGDSSNNPLYKINTTTQVSAPSVNIWHHYVMVGNGTKCYVYLDGELWAEAKTYKAISGTSIYINGWGNTTDYCYDNMDISDFRIYATALSADDVKSLYQNCATIDPDGTIRGQIRS